MQTLNPLRFRNIFQKLYCFNEIQYRPRMSKFDEPLIGSLPKKPKRPANSFVLFVRDVQQKIYADNPTFMRPDMVRIAGKLWRDMDAEEKSQYQRKFHELNKEYEEVLTNFNNSLTQEQKDKMTLFQKEEQTKKKRRKVHKTLTDLGRPKRPPSAYNLFMMERATSFEKSMDRNHYLNKMREVAEEWKNLNDEDKQVYVNKAKGLADTYYLEMKEWEKKMLQTLDMTEEDVDELRLKSPVDGAPRPRPKRLSSYIYTWITQRKNKEKEKEKKY